MVCAAALCLSALEDTRKLEVFQSSWENFVAAAISCILTCNNHSNRVQLRMRTRVRGQYKNGMRMHDGRLIAL